MFSAFDNEIDWLKWNTAITRCTLRALIQFLNEKGIMTGEDKQRLREQVSDDVRKEMHKH